MRHQHHAAAIASNARVSAAASQIDWLSLVEQQQSPRRNKSRARRERSPPKWPDRRSAVCRGNRAQRKLRTPLARAAMLARAVRDGESSARVSRWCCAKKPIATLTSTRRPDRRARSPASSLRGSTCGAVGPSKPMTAPASSYGRGSSTRAPNPVERRGVAAGRARTGSRKSKSNGRDVAALIAPCDRALSAGSAPASLGGLARNRPMKLRGVDLAHLLFTCLLRRELRRRCSRTPNSSGMTELSPPM